MPRLEMLWRLIVAILSALMLLGYANAQQNQLPLCPEPYNAAIWTNCFGETTPRAGERYVGEFRDGRPNGRGTSTWSDGGVYVGDFKDGKYEGQGAYTSPSGERYVGGYLGGKRNGQGSRRVSSGEEYVGAFKDDLAEGKGTYTWPDGQKYVGEFKDGKFDGQGTYTSPSGERYVGEYRGDKRNGRGTLRLPSGDEYVGEFKDGKRSGHGSNRITSGEGYVGEFKNDMANGKGTYIWPDGQKYVGEFKDGWFDGQGTYTSPTGEKYVGQYRNAKRNGQGDLRLPSGDEYVGEFKDGKANGKGIHYGANGSILQSGIWEDDTLVTPALVSLPNISTMSTAGALVQSPEVTRLRAEAEDARQRQQLLEEQLKQAQQQAPSSPSRPSRPLNAYALVIGNTAYPGSFRLTNPTNDARAMSQKLRTFGFNVTEVLDANRTQLVSALSQFGRTAADADLTVLFYSGHGIQFLGTNYILPTDIDQTDVSQATLQGITLNSILDQFMPGKTRIVFLDACRDNPLSRTASRGITKGLAPISVAQGTLIAYATKDGQTAADGYGQRNSPWTTALLQHIGDPLDIAIVLREVRENVMQATGGRQEPWEYGSLTGGQLVLSRLRATTAR